MKKICFITTVHGSLKAFVLVTAEYLYDSGEYDITFICSGNDEFASTLPNYIKYINIPMKRGINLDFIKVIPRLVKIFKKEKFDIVQYATPNAALYASIASIIAKVKIRIYGQWGLRYVTMKGFKRVLFKYLEKLTCRLSTHIISTSFNNRKYAINEGLYKIDKAIVLGEGGATGVDLTVYNIENKNKFNQLIRERYNLDDCFIFGFVGRFSRDKGANELLQAIKNISQDSNVKLICIGDIELSSDMDMQLYEWAKNSNRVIFTGRIDNLELPKYYSAMDCYVHPSYREGYPKVLQEAASMGCAIITTDIPGASEVLENGTSCLLVPPRDAQALENRMRQIINDNNLRYNLGLNARKRAEQHFERKMKLRIQKEFYDSL